MKGNVFLGSLVVFCASLLIVVNCCINSYFERNLFGFIMNLLFVVMDGIFFGVYLLKAISYGKYLKVKKQMDDSCKEFMEKVNSGELDNERPFMEFENGKSENQEK